jgi:hypothetical protein
MNKAPPWHTPAWRLPEELRPIYAAVNRVHELEAKPGVSQAEIAVARRAVDVAAVELTRLADAMKLYQERNVTVRYFGRA